jgi:hypothetical protein
MTFFLFSGPELGPALDLSAANRESEALLEKRVRRLTRSRLRYFAAVLPARLFELCF